MPETTDEVHVEVDGRTLKISNLSKVLYPLTGTTKGEVLNYYARIAPILLPHLAHRAVTRIRWPHGTSDMQFFEKNVPNGVPSWIRTVTVPSTGSHRWLPTARPSARGCPGSTRWGPDGCGRRWSWRSRRWA